MSESAEARTQHGDLKGTVSIDGHQGAFLQELAKRTDMPGSYCPVGLGLYFQEGRLQAYLLAADRSVMKDNEGDLPVFKFRFDATADDISQFCKRVHIIVKDKALKNQSMKILEDN